MAIDLEEKGGLQTRRQGRGSQPLHGRGGAEMAAVLPGGLACSISVLPEILAFFALECCKPGWFPAFVFWPLECGGVGP